MQITIVRGTQAHFLLLENVFSAEWSALAGRCPWATAFQTPSFAIEWYRAYRQQFEPILVLSRNAAGLLDGLLSLGLCRANGKLVAAGADLAEYQAWLCIPELAGSFPAEAFDLLRREFPSASLRLRHLPPQVPLQFLIDSRQSRATLLKASRRPLMTFGDGSAIEEALRLSGNRSRLRQLQKIGAIEFKRVTDPAEFAPLLDEVARYHDCRLLASHGLTPFIADSWKKDFHLAMMNMPGLLHVTILKVGRQLASAHLNIIPNKEVQLGLIVQNPMLAHYSPGKLHILYLAQMLREEGYRRLDLTSDGDAYKERLATAADQVHSLSIFPTASVRRRSVIGAWIGNATRVASARIGIKSARVRSLPWKTRDIGWIGLALCLARFAGKWVCSRRETRIYGYAAARARALEVPDGIRRDHLDDLLAYQSDGSGLSRQEFLADALKRFESGQHVYTTIEEGCLLLFGWLAENAAEDAFCEIGLPPHSAAVLNFQTTGTPSRGNLSSLALRTMLRDAGRIEGLRAVFVALPSRSRDAREAAKAIGFDYYASIFRRTRFGRSRTWSQTAPHAVDRGDTTKLSELQPCEEASPSLGPIRSVPASRRARAIST